MPRKEINDYIFYKIVCLDNSVELCYVGSTANWKARNHQHKSDCNNENCKIYNSKIYKTIRENGGWGNFKMIDIGKKEQLTKRQAEQIEDEYRVELKANMNSKRCYITEQQKIDKHKENNKNYRNNNIDKIKEYHQKYYGENKDKILEYQQNYYEENKDKILEYNQKWCEENRDKFNKKVKCECGCKIIKQHLNKHILTPKHIKLMNQINNQ